MYEIDNEDIKIVTHCYNQKIKYFGKKYEKYRHELIVCGYIDLMEFKKNKENYIDINQLFKVVNSSLRRELYKIQKENEVESLSVEISSKDKKQRTFEDMLIDNSVYFDNFDYKFLKSSFKEQLKEYSKDDKRILLFYFFQEECNPHVCCTNLGISRNKLKELVRGFRDELGKALILQGYEKVKDYLTDIDEFTESNCHRLRRERNEAKKHGITLYNVNDYKIYKLIRESVNIEKFANSLNISQEKLNKIIHHTEKTKLYLYQVQALRIKYFANYSLAELVAI